MRLVPMLLHSSTNTLQAQTMPTKSWRLSNGSDGHILTMPSLIHSISLSDFSQQQATSSIVVMTGWRHNHRHIHNMWDKVLNDTHLMLKHTPWLVDGNKWCDNKVQTPDVHCALKPHHGCQQRTQSVMSVGKVAWMTITQMPCDNTHNHAWRVFFHNPTIVCFCQWTNWHRANSTVPKRKVRSIALWPQARAC